MNLRTDSPLRSLDAAVATLTDEEQTRAQQTLERIVATAPTTAATQPQRPAPARRLRRRLILIPAAAAALAAGSVVVQAVHGGEPAYASWTSTPAAVARHDLDAAATACQDQLRHLGSSINPDRATLVLAERRGDHVTLLYRTENPDASAACLVRNPPGTTDAQEVGIGVGTSDGPAPKAPPTGYTQDTVAQFAGASITDGAVGAAVTGVTIHTGTRTVTASVHNGRYAAWWPGTAFPNGPTQPSGHGGPEPSITYDLTLTNGTVIHNAAPTHHP